MCMHKNGHCEVHGVFSTAMCAHCWSSERSRRAVVSCCFCEAPVSAQTSPARPAPLHLREPHRKVGPGGHVFGENITRSSLQCVPRRVRMGRARGGPTNGSAQCGGKQPDRAHRLFPVPIAVSRVSVGSQGYRGWDGTGQGGMRGCRASNGPHGRSRLRQG